MKHIILPPSPYHGVVGFLVINANGSFSIIPEEPAFGRIDDLTAEEIEIFK